MAYDRKRWNPIWDAVAALWFAELDLDEEDRAEVGRLVKKFYRCKDWTADEMLKRWEKCLAMYSNAGPHCLAKRWAEFGPTPGERKKAAYWKAEEDRKNKQRIKDDEVARLKRERLFTPEVTRDGLGSIAHQN